MKIKAIINSNGEKIVENLEGILDMGIISYHERDNTYVSINTLKNELVRENVTIKLRYTFDLNKPTKGYIHVKEVDSDVLVDIRTNTIINDEYKYYVEYTIEDDAFIYELDYMEVE